MKALHSFLRFFLRFRYPMTLPEDVAEALGVKCSNYLNFEEFVKYLTCPSCCPTRLERFMSREDAEQVFFSAQCKEIFKDRTLISYQFNEGWMEFDLQFDSDSRLRRLYIQHNKIEAERGYEIKLKNVA